MTVWEWVTIGKARYGAIRGRREPVAEIFAIDHPTERLGSLYLPYESSCIHSYASTLGFSLAGSAGWGMGFGNYRWFPRRGDQESKPWRVGKDQTHAPSTHPFQTRPVVCRLSPVHHRYGLIFRYPERKVLSIPTRCDVLPPVASFKPFPIRRGSQGLPGRAERLTTLRLTSSEPLLEVNGLLSTFEAEFELR